MVTGMTTRRTSRDILVQDSRAFLDGFAANQRADPQNVAVPFANGA